MDPSNFDEFGNYIGPDLSGSEEVRSVQFIHRIGKCQEMRPVLESFCLQDDIDEENLDTNGAAGDSPAYDGNGADVHMEDTALADVQDYEAQDQIVLHEDKKYYPTAEEVYGKETETLVMEEDAQPLEVCSPIELNKIVIFLGHTLQRYQICG